MEIMYLEIDIAAIEGENDDYYIQQKRTFTYI